MNETEDRIQSQAYIWFHNTYPHLRGLLCYNLNNSRNAIEGNKNKGMGLQVGRSDMVLYMRGTAYMIEFKTPEGRQSKEQVVWQACIEGQGFKYVIVRSLSEFQAFIASVDIMP